MAVVKRIGAGSAFKVGFVIYGILGLIAGVFCSAVALAGVAFAPHAPPFLSRKAIAFNRMAAIWAVAAYIPEVGLFR